MRGGYRTRAARRIHGESILRVLLKAAVYEFGSEAIDDIGGDRSFRHLLEFELNGVLCVDAGWAHGRRLSGNASCMPTTSARMASS
jgi:hypothetical protein